jgi:LuxR family maltose regulon positive regulatory protein
VNPSSFEIGPSIVSASHTDNPRRSAGVRTTVADRILGHDGELVHPEHLTTRRPRQYGRAHSDDVEQVLVRQHRRPKRRRHPPARMKLPPTHALGAHGAVDRPAPAAGALIGSAAMQELDRLTDPAADDPLAELLLDAKFSVPSPRPGAISRDDLIQRARSSACPVVGVTAPAGYGKSTFLAEWARLEDRQVGWVSLDHFDDDPAALVTLLASVYSRMDPSRAFLVAELGGAGVSLLGRTVPRLASAFASSPVPFALFLDDLHELRSPDCHDVLGIIAAKIPSSSQLVIASRSEQPHVPRLRAAGTALELDMLDLALDATAARQIFAGLHVTLSADQAAEVTQRTEGWPVGLHLAALIAREHDAGAPFITGDDRYVADYLYRESLRHQSDDMQAFLRRTAVLDQMCGPLCDALLSSSDSARKLRQLEASDHFLIPIDRRREWWRYHALFREFLLGELRRTEPDLVSALHLNAADWFESQRSPERALEHLLHTPARPRASRVATGLMLSTYNGGRLSTIQRWLDTLGDESIREYPPLAVLAGHVGILTGDTAAAERWASFVEQCSFDDVSMDGTASFDSARAMLRGVMCATSPEAMLHDATFAVAQERPGSPWRDTALWELAEALLLVGRVDEARARFVESSTCAAAMDNSDSLISSESQLALLAMDRGDWDEAAGHVKVALQAIDDSLMHDNVLSLIGYVAAARLALHDGRVDVARTQLVRAMRSRPSATFVTPVVAVRLRVELAKSFLAMSETTTARHLLREIDDILIHRPSLGRLVDEVVELRTRAVAAGADRTTASPLTPAELRLLPYLQTHLNFRQIGERLFISRHTVASEVHAIYRKLGVSSRHDAVHEATAIGLLGG